MKGKVLLLVLVCEEADDLTTVIGISPEVLFHVLLHRRLFIVREDRTHQASPDRFVLLPEGLTTSTVTAEGDVDVDVDVDVDMTSTCGDRLRSVVVLHLHLHRL